MSAPPPLSPLEMTVQAVDGLILKGLLAYPEDRAGEGFSAGRPHASVSRHRGQLRTPGGRPARSGDCDARLRSPGSRRFHRGNPWPSGDRHPGGLHDGRLRIGLRGQCRQGGVQAHQRRHHSRGELGCGAELHRCRPSHPGRLQRRWNRCGARCPQGAGARGADNLLRGGRAGLG